MPRAGFTQQIGDVQLTILAPGKDLLKGTDSDANNNSLVMRLVYKDVSLLLTGDMEKEERATVAAWPKTTALKLAHHGSRNGTDAAFLTALAPAAGMISCAADNSYGHPHPEVINALQQAKVPFFVTATNGTVLFTTDGKTLAVSFANKASQTTDAGEKNYIGNKNSRIFHRPSCGSLPAEKNRVYFRTRDEAINAGYRACKKCKP